MSLIKKESFRPLEEEDRVRIKKVLDYWFCDEVQSSQSSFGDGIEI
jgi:hypothetical protein